MYFGSRLFSAPNWRERLMASGKPDDKGGMTNNTDNVKKPAHLIGFNLAGWKAVQAEKKAERAAAKHRAQLAKKIINVNG